jgi:organic radical activating enzyme
VNILTSLRLRFFPPHQPIPNGLYPYSSAVDGEPPFRLQLRIEPDGRGLLIVNGSTVLHLNQTAAEYIYHFTIGTSIETIKTSISKRYGIQPKQAAADYTALVDNLKALINTPDLDPVTFLDFDQTTLYSGAISAPYRLDCALTYQTPDANHATYAPIERVKRELSENEWQIILREAWNAGIPHVVFTGGEPTLRPDLLALVQFASSLGMVTGLITQASLLSSAQFLHEILQSGLDHLMLILDTSEEQSWEALKAALLEDISVTVHLTLTPNNTFEDGMVFDRLEEMGVARISLSTSDTSLNQQLTQARNAIAQRSIRLVWDLPVPYSKFHPVALEMEHEEKPPDGAGVACLYVEPDGDVLHSQGDPTALGNFLTDSWIEIWKHRR